MKFNENIETKPLGTWETESIEFDETWCLILVKKWTIKTKALRVDSRIINIKGPITILTEEFYYLRKLVFTSRAKITSVN
jgi:hypothetical protein